MNSNAAVKQLLMSEMSKSQEERLFYIDFRLYFLGCINRADLVKRFGIKEAAASRDLSAYKAHAADNLIYDSKEKKYTPSDNFKPLFKHRASQVISALQFGFGDDFIDIPSPLISTEAPIWFGYPDLNILSVVTKAIYQNKALNISYRSLSRGKTSRQIIPFALAYTGVRWHARAFDSKTKEYRDFVLNRVETIELVEQEISCSPIKEGDNQWNRIVELQITPHPLLRHPKTIEHEYRMKDGFLAVEIRAAIAGYLLRLWNVDCSSEPEKSDSSFQLYLKNRQALYAVENLIIAPNYIANDNKQS